MASTGAEVTWKGKTVKTPNGKTRVDLKYPNGKEVTSYWGTSTEVGVKGPEDKSEEKLDEVKYKLKLGAKAAPAPAEPPADSAPAEEPTDDLDFSTDDAGTEDQADTSSEETPTDDTATDDSGSSDKPFNDEPFDAGVEADEESDPKKFIEQLTGKLGQSLRKYEEDQGEPDFELEKFAINSLLSATHTAEMDSKDQKDIIKKVKSAGKGDGDEESTDDTETTDTETTDTETTDDGETTDTETTDTETTDDSENMFESEDLEPHSDIWVQEGDIYYDKNRDCNYIVTKVNWKTNNIIYTSNCFGGRSVGNNYKLNDNIFKGMIYDKEIVKVKELANRQNFEKVTDTTPMKTGWKKEYQRLYQDNDKVYRDILQKYKNKEIDSDEFKKQTSALIQIDERLNKITEMSLNDHMANSLIELYDNSQGDNREIIFRKVTLTKPFPEKDEKDKDINRQKFLADLQDDIDKEHIEEIMDELAELGIYDNKKAKVVKMFENSMILQNPPKNNMFQPGSNDILDEKDDRCTRIAKRKYDVWPSAYASGAVVKCRQGKIWKNVDENYLEELDSLEEKWSAKYKKSIDCSNPKGFSQKAHCQGKKKHG